MKNTFIPLSIILLLVIVLGILFSKNIQHTVNWEESFNERSKNPYGLKVFYNELGKLYEEQNFRTVYYQPDSYLGANSEGSYGLDSGDCHTLKITFRPNSMSKQVTVVRTHALKDAQKTILFLKFTRGDL